MNTDYPLADQPWPITILGDCIVFNDAAYSKRVNWPVINYLDTGNITDNRVAEVQCFTVGEDKIPTRAKRMVNPGDIVYSTVRPTQRHYGIIKEPPNNLLASTGFSVFRADPEMASTEFIYWFLTQDHIVEHLQTLAEQNTSTYPSINPSDLASIQLRLPPIDHQHAIANILGALDRRIELNRRINETLQGIAHTMFKSWFIEFEPVRAKIEERWHPGESLPGLPAELYQLFPDKLEPSELGPTPTSWRIEPLSSIAVAHNRKVTPSEVDPHTSYIGLQHMPRRSLAINEWGTASAVISDKSRFRAGDILFGKLRPYFHKVAIAPINGIASTDIIVLSSKLPHWNAMLSCVLSSDQFVAYTDRTSTGTKMPRTSWETMSEYKLCLPPEPLASAFQSAIGPHLHKIVQNCSDTQTLLDMRTTLLPKLLAGTMPL